MNTIISYTAKVKKIDGTIETVTGNALFEEYENITQYKLECRILFDNWKNGEAVGTDNVTIINWGIER